MYFDDNIREKLKSYTDANGKTIDNYPALRKYAKPLKKAERPIIGREVEMDRVMASLMRPELCNVMLLAEAGSGKAFEDSTPIPVSDMRGYVPIGDMSVGDMVFDESGKPVNVLGVFHQGKKRAYRVTFADGSQLICNDEHLWNVRTRYQHYHDRDYTTMTLRQIMDYGVVRSLAGGEMKSFYIPLNGAVERDEVDLPVHPYVLGALIGDGCLSGERVLTISSPDDGVPKKVASLIGAVGVQRNPNNYDWQFLSDGDVKFIRQADLADKCDFDNVFYTKSIYRRIPEIYKVASISQRMALLQGLMDTDGSLDNSDRHHCMFSTNSKGLAYDVLELLRSLGIRASIFESEREDKVNVEYSVFIKLPDEEKRKLFTDASGKGNISMIDNRRYHRIYNDMAIVDVEDLGYDVDMTCIYVDSESHLFQAGKEHIVTHNTALVQGCMLKDKDRYYLEVEPSKIIASVDKDRMANELKRLFDETEKFCKVNNVELVLFIDEFHQIVQLSDAAVEALKPLLADSGTRGIRVIAATTYDEFRMYIKPNQPLVERLQRINLEPPSKDMVIRILRDMARRYGVDNQFYDDNIFGLIYDLTNRYVPASAQPRKSLLVFDAMVGWYRFSHRRMNKKLLADVIYESTNVNVAFKVDATKIKKELDAHVFAQENATNIIAHRLQVCVADLHDKTKPMSSFLFCGSTGTGKLVANYEPVPVYTEDGSIVTKRHGDLVVGDVVFDRHGKPTKVVGIFPHKDVKMYRVTLTDGRTLDVGDEHLWSVYSAKDRQKYNKGQNVPMRVMSTKDLVESGVVREYDKDKRRHLKWFIPMNGAVEWTERNVDVHPYVMGAMLGNGCLILKPLTFSSTDEEVVHRISNYLGAKSYMPLKDNYSWVFELPEKHGNQKYFYAADVFANYPDVLTYSSNRRIPKDYMYGSIEQRWDLIHGFFDTDGSVTSDNRIRVSYSTFSEGLALDVQNVLYSLGISSTINLNSRIREDGNGNVRELNEYTVRVKASDEDKFKLFTLERKLHVIREHMRTDKKRVKKYDFVGIADIQEIGVQDAQCIYVDNKEHLYQAGQFVVTHNTEMTKQLARILFDDSRRLIRFDMTEYANPESLSLFRKELTARIWERPYSIILLDEIEKACAEVTRLLLQVLDDGRLMDENNREVPFVNAYIIITTNAGSEVFKNIAQYDADDAGSGKQMQKYMKLIRQSITSTTGDNKFPPELLGRLDAIVPFQPLSEATQMKIVHSKLQSLANQVKAVHGVELVITNNVVDYIVRDNLTTDSDAGGARAAISKLNDEVVATVASYLNSHPNINTPIIATVSGDMAWQDKSMLESKAHIVVGPYKQIR